MEFYHAMRDLTFVIRFIFSIAALFTVVLLQLSNPSVENVDAAQALLAQVQALQYGFENQQLQHNITITAHLSRLNYTMIQLSDIVNLDGRDYTLCNPLLPANVVRVKQCTGLPKALQKAVEHARESEGSTREEVERGVYLVVDLWGEIEREVEGFVKEAVELQGILEELRGKIEDLTCSNDGSSSLENGPTEKDEEESLNWESDKAHEMPGLQRSISTQRALHEDTPTANPLSCKIQSSHHLHAYTMYPRRRIPQPL